MKKPILYKDKLFYPIPNMEEYYVSSGGEVIINGRQIVLEADRFEDENGFYFEYSVGGGNTLLSSPREEKRFYITKDLVKRAKMNSSERVPVKGSLW